MRARTNLVFVGCGNVFSWHASDYMIAAGKDAGFFFVDPDDEKAAWLSARGLTRVDLEHAARIATAAFITTPNYLRREVCQPFVEHGVPIVVEKPLTIRWSEIDWFEKAEAAGAWICPVLNARKLEKVEEIIRWAKRRPPVDSITSWKNRHRSPAYYMDWHGKYATDGGVLAQQGFHCLDLVCLIGGKVDYVAAVGKNRVHPIECEDTARVDIQFANGAHGLVECTTADPEDGHAGLRVRRASEWRETSGPGFVKPGSGKHGHARLAEAVFEALRAGQPPPITVASAAPALRVLHACYRSMESGGKPTAVGEPFDKLGAPIPEKDPPSRRR